jgi:hypothetical protein
VTEQEGSLLCVLIADGVDEYFKYILRLILEMSRECNIKHSREKY